MQTTSVHELPQGAVFTGRFVVSGEVYEGFMATFNDRNPYHVDDEAARGKGFAAKIMHGNILNGFLSYFIGECLPTRSVLIQSQTIKYLKPFYLAETLTLHALVENWSESVRTAEIKFHFENDQGQKVAQGRLLVGLL